MDFEEYIKEYLQWNYKHKLPLQFDDDSDLLITEMYGYYVEKCYKT